MKLKIEVGAKAKAIRSIFHNFSEGQEIEFIGYGIMDDEDKYYEYAFKGYCDELGRDRVQYLEADEFTLIQE